MEYFNFEDLWKIMSCQNVMTMGDIKNDLNCIICHKILIDPYVTDCQCHFCFKCIKERLENGRDQCPGGQEECKNMTLKLNENIIKDVNNYQNLLSIIIKCPNELCTTEIILREIVEHLRICEKKIICCPYQEIGCLNDGLTENNLKEHLLEDIETHSQLLIETINNWKNDVARLTQMEKEREVKENILKNENDNNKRIIYDLQKQVRELKKRIQNKTMSMKDIDKQEIENNIKELTEIRWKEILKHTTELYDLKKEVLNINIEIEKINRRLVELKLHHDFIWTIDNFSKRKGQYYESNSFYIDNYKACIRTWIDGYNLYLYFWLLEGDNDDFVEWPMKHTVVLNILNQDTLRVYASMRYSFGLNSTRNFGFERPLAKRNNHIGGIKVPRTDIDNIPGLLCSDTVMVSCSVVRPSS